MTEPTEVFWDDLAKDLEDPEFLRDYIIESIRIAAIDRLMSQLEAARSAIGFSKAELARATNASPASIRRLLSSRNTNPTLGTLTEIAAVLGYSIELVPLTARQRSEISVPLQEGKASDTTAVARQFDSARRAKVLS